MTQYTKTLKRRHSNKTFVLIYTFGSIVAHQILSLLYLFMTTHSYVTNITKTKRSKAMNLVK